MKNTVPHQNAHLHSQNPSPACGETGYPKGGRRDENPVPIPLDHKSLPISTVEEIAEKTKKNPSPACGRTGSPKGGRRDEKPVPIPLGHRPLPILRREKTFLKTANNPSSRLRKEVSRSDGGGQKRLSVLLGGPSNHTAWRGQCLSRLVRCQSQILHGKIPSPACGGRWPKAGRGDKKPGFIPLGEPSNHTAWRTQHLRRLAGPATMPLG